MTVPQSMERQAGSDSHGAVSANITPCSFWKHEPSEPPVAINDKGPRNVLLL